MKNLINYLFVLATLTALGLIITVLVLVSPVLLGTSGILFCLAILTKLYQKSIKTNHRKVNNHAQDFQNY